MATVRRMAFARSSGSSGPTLPVTAGLFAWYDADAEGAAAGYGEGADVLQLTDWSGNERHATQIDVLKRGTYHPARSPTGRGAVQFPGGGTNYRHGGITGEISAAAHTMVMHLAPTAVTGYALHCSLQAASGPPSWLGSADRHMGFGGALSSNYATTSVPGNFGSPPINGTAHDIGVWRHYTKRMNAGNAEAIGWLGSVSKVFALAPGVPGFLSVGGGVGAATNTATKYMGECLYYSRTLTLEEIAEIYVYLEAKWGTGVAP